MNAAGSATITYSPSFLISAYEKINLQLFQSYTDELLDGMNEME